MMKKADKLFEKEHMSYRSSSVNEETRYSYVVKALTDLILFYKDVACAAVRSSPTHATTISDMVKLLIYILV